MTGGPLNDSELRLLEAEAKREDVRRLVAEVRRLRGELERVAGDEREECARIAEDHLNRLYHAHGPTGERAVADIVAAIRGRSAPRE
ncbi:MAG: hypothetical protein ACREKN_00855 [Longimicrobiaceae bacterium]